MRIRNTSQWKTNKKTHRKQQQKNIYLYNCVQL